MSSRLATLEDRRRLLLHKCEEQRLELTSRLAQLRPREHLAAWTRHSAAAHAQTPIAWIAGIVGLLLMLRRRRALAGVGWATGLTGLVALASKATTVLRVLAQVRAVYRGFKATQHPR
jgi:hypothetical protein